MTRAIFLLPLFARVEGKRVGDCDVGAPASNEASKQG